MTVFPNLWDWFADNFGPVIKNCFRWLMDSHVAWLGGSILVWLKIAVFVIGALELFRVSLHLVVTSMGDIVFDQIAKPNAGVIAYAAFINRFVPLAEIFAFVVVFWHVYLAIIAFRWIKQFIPAMSN